MRSGPKQMIRRGVDGSVRCGSETDLTLLLDIPVNVSQERVSDRHHSTGEIQDQFDESGAKFLERVLDGFHILAKAEPERFRTINANQSLDCVSNEIWDTIKDQI